MTTKYEKIGSIILDAVTRHEEKINGIMDHYQTKNETEAHRICCDSCQRNGQYVIRACDYENIVTLAQEYLIALETIKTLEEKLAKEKIEK